MYAFKDCRRLAEITVNDIGFLVECLWAQLWSRICLRIDVRHFPFRDPRKVIQWWCLGVKEANNPTWYSLLLALQLEYSYRLTLSWIRSLSVFLLNVYTKEKKIMLNLWFKKSRLEAEMKKEGISFLISLFQHFRITLFSLLLFCDLNIYTYLFICIYLLFIVNDLFDVFWVYYISVDLCDFICVFLKK